MDRLVELRNSRNMKQAEIAKLLGIHRTTYNKYENGESSPSYEILKNIARLFNVSTDYLLEYEQPGTEEKQSMTSVPPKNINESLSEEERKLLQIYSQLNQKGRNFLLKEADHILEQSDFRQAGTIASGQ